MKAEKVFEWSLVISFIVMMAALVLLLMGCTPQVPAKSECVSWAVGVQKDGSRIYYCEASVRERR